MWRDSWGQALVRLSGIAVMLPVLVAVIAVSIVLNVVMWPMGGARINWKNYL